jgi:Domain of unknown function (DUF4336)
MRAPDLDTRLTEYVPSRIWLKKYPVQYAGASFFARATFVRLSDGSVLVHSPCPIDETLEAELKGIGPVKHIVAPGSYHYFHVTAWQTAYPEATTWICPGVERKCPGLEFDWLLSDRAPEVWRGELDQALVRGNRFIWEVAFFDRPSKTLVLTDLIENIGEHTEGTDWVLKFWWKVVMRMWGRPRPAPEYQMGWQDKAAAKRSLQRILKWDFERIVIAHGDNIDANAKATAREAWAKPLSFKDSP